MSTQKHIVKVTNLCPQVEEDDVRIIFSFIGEVIQTKLIVSAAGTKEALVTFSDTDSQELSIYLSGSELGDRKFQVSKVDPSLLSTDAISAFNTMTIPGSVISASYYANPQGHIAGPLGTEFQANAYGMLPGFGATQPAAATYSIPLGNPEVIAMMASKPRQLEPIPPSIAAMIHPAILQHDPVKAEEISRTVYVGNISSTISDQELMDFFGCCGYVAYVKMAGDGSQPTRFAFIEFTTIDAAQTAMSMSGIMLAGRPLKINYSKNSINKPPLPGSASITSVSYTSNPPSAANSQYPQSSFSALPNTDSTTTSDQRPALNVSEDEAMRKIKEAKEKLLQKYGISSVSATGFEKSNESPKTSRSSRSRSNYRSRSRSYRDSRHSSSRYRDRSKDRNRSRDKYKSSERDRSRDKYRTSERDRSRDRYRSKDRRRESTRNRSRDREENKSRERRRSSDRKRSKERDGNKPRERKRSRERISEKDDDRSKDRARERR
ncbi:Splicing regulatory glutamine/lysine-rich protein 1 [Smittium culicis]|uniref:Splicing regulatory glutamine/lysine-rich protein 1 n=2 Tax=Smittium culicis TaxID=133412 RepID=A0A1R1YFL2_9FUNG|nr:Splicing regulatory glutamine/lysine-rich protein 1 [Smittium culicis]